MLRIAINGYGRIGRSVLRALYESNTRQWAQVVAINEPADAKTIAVLEDKLATAESLVQHAQGQISEAAQR